jgi:hypothetical protein
MRATRCLCCANLRTLGLDSSRQHTAAEIKAAFLKQAKLTHPDTGGDAARFRQLKDAYDVLREKGSGGDGGERPSYGGVFNGVGGPGSAQPQQPTRSHIFTERYNNGDATSQSEKGTWDYGSGVRYANNSTRSFYRPYTSNYYDPSATGFTREEVARAELAMRLHVLKRILWNCLVFGSALYLLYVYLPRTERISPLSTDYSVGLDDDEKARREGELRRMQPQLQPHWSDAHKARYVQEWNSRFQDCEHAMITGHGVPFQMPVTPHSGIAVAALDSVSFSSPDTYIDMADEDVDVE